MEAFKKQSYSVDSASAMSGLKTQWSNEKDKEIAERLQKLKRERIKEDLPSEMEIEERLAKLKGMDPSKYKAPPIQVYRPSRRQTSVEQAEDLMMQVTEEVQLDSKLIKPEDEIAARLARLRDEVPEKMEVEEKLSTEQGASQDEIDLEKSHSAFQSENELLSKLASKELKEVITDPEYQKLVSSMQHSKETEHESDEEQEANKLVEKLMASNIDDEELESFNGQETEKTEEDSIEEEFPWCIICTEDAKMRCFGCDGDLYCIRCFKECHDSLDIKDHKTCPYLSPKKPSI
ncbi:Zinc finger FYVE domain-containing protein 19, partial [Stegodyphus mimosarum]